MTGVDDPGLDRLQAAVVRQQQRRSSSTLAPAAAAQQPLVELTSPAALAIAAPAAAAGMTGIGRSVYWTVRELLEDRGADVDSAHKIALRSARLVLLEHAGADKQEAAQTVGVTSRQGRLDLERVRGLGPGVFEPDGPLPSVPRSPADRVRLVSAGSTCPA